MYNLEINNDEYLQHTSWLLESSYHDVVYFQLPKYLQDNLALAENE